MNGDIIKGPKGFVTYARFFEQIGDRCDPVRLSDEQKKAFIARLKSLDPQILPHCRVSEDWRDSAVVRESIMLSDDRLYVRYEASCRRQDGDWDGPYQMLVIWNGQGEIVAYTFIHETGRDTKVAASMYTSSCDRSEYTTNMERATWFSLAMEQGDAVIIGNDDCDGEFICISTDHGKPRISWQVFGSPYCFNSINSISWPDVVHAIRIFQTKGIRGAQQLAEWEIAEACDENTRMMTFQVPLILRRMLSGAIKSGDKDCADQIHDCGISINGELPEYEVRCAYGDDQQVMQALREQVVTMSDPMKRKMLQIVIDRGAGIGCENRQ